MGELLNYCKVIYIYSRNHEQQRAAMEKYSELLDTILTLPPSLLEILKEGNYDSHYECSECKYVHESLPHNSR